MTNGDTSHAPTSDQLRHEIDRGATGEKVDFPDPAMAPLGTDDEAAGAPPSAAERRSEGRRLAAMTPVSDHRQDTASWPYWAIAAAIGLILSISIAIFA